ncbi:uncharacterized protein J4E84_006203 [Alternaria hordeiaustralica]|uniref:uncharacterized protein n=1 Tax=Alternaria hordeiaustralica TaxID=1187925 RepID=UPI0020C344F1|nr:uncharacterized protein J4E84_006203 [Alternaria hordeiaustralica]KAI4685475.1 hypothetical protein J4E84_006203 [Alternaria hordeiaustralica]
MARIYPNTLWLSKQGEIRRFRKIYAKLAVEPKVERMSEFDQIKIAEAIYQGKLRLNDNGDGMLDATPPTTDLMAIVSSPLLRLPVEVRNKIFAYVNNGLRVFMRAGPGNRATRSIKNGTHEGASSVYPPFLDLQHTCRQIYNETALLPFSTNEYWYYTVSSLNACKPLFLGPQWECIRYISFPITIRARKELPVIGNFDVRRLEGLKAFSRLEKVTFYLNTEHPNAERRFEDVKTVLKHYLKEVVSADVKIVYEHRYREADFVSWPLPY